jgi:peptide/nickel transport system permease protein
MSELANRLAGTRRLPRMPAGAVLCGLLLAVIVAAAVLPGPLAGHSPVDTDPVAALQAPGPTHWFGTDQLGRDVFARMVYGARLSLLTGVVATLLAVLAGAAAGLLAALAGRVTDQVLMRFVDVLLAFPGLLLSLLVVVVLGPGPRNATIAVAAAAVPGFARVVRAQALAVRRAEYVEAARTLGQHPARLLLVHIVPNVLSPLLVLGTISVGTSIITASSLSFLGLGPRPPTPEWGLMLADGRQYLAVAWWVAVFPGLAITLTVVTVTVLGRYLQAVGERRSQ